MKIDDWSNWSKSNILTLLRQRIFLNCKLALQWNNFLIKNPDFFRNMKALFMKWILYSILDNFLHLQFNKWHNHRSTCNNWVKEETICETSENINKVSVDNTARYFKYVQSWGLKFPIICRNPPLYICYHVNNPVNLLFIRWIRRD